MEKKSENVKFRVTPTELRLINQQAESYGLNVSNYVRRAALNTHPIDPLYSKRVGEFLNYITIMTGNICRMENPPEKEDWQEFRETVEKGVREIWRFLR